MQNIRIKTKGYRPQIIIFDYDTFIESVIYEWRCKMNLGVPKVYTLIDGKEQSINKVLFKMNRNQILIHKNNDLLDFTSNNIEILSRAEYGRRYASSNMKIQKSKYKNVSWSSNEGKWKTRFTKNDKVIYERYFESEEDAALVADFKSYDLYGNTCGNYKNLSVEQIKAQYEALMNRFGETRKEIKSKSNQRNSKSVGASKYIGVSRDKRRNKWTSRVKYHGKCYSCGYYVEEKDAAKAYNKKVLELYGEDAKLNEV